MYVSSEVCNVLVWKQCENFHKVTAIPPHNAHLTLKYKIDLIRAGSCMSHQCEEIHDRDKVCQFTAEAYRKDGDKWENPAGVVRVWDTWFMKIS